MKVTIGKHGMQIVVSLSGKQYIVEYVGGHYTAYAMDDGKRVTKRIRMPRSLIAGLLDLDEKLMYRVLQRKPI